MTFIPNWKIEEKVADLYKSSSTKVYYLTEKELKEYRSIEPTKKDLSVKRNIVFDMDRAKTGNSLKYEK